MKRHPQTVWTPKATPRPGTPMGFAVLNIRATFDENRDILSFDVDGVPHEWYRRGAPFFKTRQECAEYIRQQWPLNDPDGLAQFQPLLSPGQQA